MDLYINGNERGKTTEELLPSVNSYHTEKAQKHDVVQMPTDGFLKTLEEKKNHTGVYGYPEHTDDNNQESGAQTKDVKQLLMDNLDMIKQMGKQEDFSQLEELGIIPDEDDPCVVVSVYDRIQIALATYCEDYQVTGNVSAKAIEKVAGNPAMAQQIQSCMNQIENLKSVSDESKAYMVQNQMAPSVDNLYKAQHAVNTGNTYRPIANEQWQQLQSQVHNILQKGGLEATPKQMDTAKWLMDYQLPVTVDNVNLAMDIENVTVPDSVEAFVEQISAGISLGMEPGQISLVQGAYSVTNVSNAMHVLNQTTSRTVDELVASGREWNIANLSYILNQVQAGNMTQSQSDNLGQGQSGQHTYNQHSLQSDNGQSSGGTQTESALSYEQVKARRVVEEIRLQLTISSGMVMQKAGISIETTQLSLMVDYLKEQEVQAARQMFDNIGYTADAEQIDQYIAVQKTVVSLQSAPAYALADTLMLHDMPSVVQMQSIVVNWSSTKAMQASVQYETMGTEVRRDLGDSIYKAFDSVDSILEQNGYELTEQNQRAVRILAYNSLEITQDNMIKIKQMDMQMQRLFGNMNPKTAAYLVANGVNPLETDIATLNEQLEQIQDEIGTTSEKYSEYLWKLCKQDKISEEERNAYVGIYRVLRMVEKSDGAVLGALMEQGAPFTMKNLLTGCRSKKASGMDVEVNESFGMIEQLWKSEDGLDETLLAYFQTHQTQENQEQAHNYSQYANQQIRQVLEHISPAKLQEYGTLEQYGEMSLEQFAQKMLQESATSQEETKQYYQAKYAESIQWQQISESNIDFVLASGQKPTLNHLMVASMMMNTKGGMFAKLQDESKEDESFEKVYEEGLDLLESMNSGDEAEQAYKVLEQHVKESIQGVLEKGVKTDVQLAAYRYLEQGFSFMRKASENKQYQIPIEVNGETACVHLTIQNDRAEKGKVSIQMDSEQTGKFYCRMHVKDGKLRGQILVQDEQWLKYMKDNQNALTAQLEQTGVQVESMNILQESSLNDNLWLAEAGANKEQVDNRILYSVAKQFIITVKEWAMF